MNTVGRRNGGIGERGIEHCRKEEWRDMREGLNTVERRNGGIGERGIEHCRKKE